MECGCTCAMAGDVVVGKGQYGFRKELDLSSGKGFALLAIVPNVVECGGTTSNTVCRSHGLKSGYQNVWSQTDGVLWDRGHEWKMLAIELATFLALGAERVYLISDGPMAKRFAPISYQQAFMDLLFEPIAQVNLDCQNPPARWDFIGSSHAHLRPGGSGSTLDVFSSNPAGSPFWQFRSHPKSSQRPRISSFADGMITWWLPQKDCMEMLHAVPPASFELELSLN